MKLTQITILENLSEGALLVNDRGIIEYANPAFEAILGYSNTEITGKALSILIPMGNRERHKGHFDNYFKKPVNRKMGNGQILYGQHKNNSTIPIEVSLSYLEVDNIKLCMAIVVDVTERINLLNELNFSRSLYASLVENSSDNIFQLDLNFRIQYINHLSPGLKKEEVLGQNLIDLLPDQGAKEKVSLCLDKSIRKGSTEQYDIKFPSPFGTLYYTTVVNPVIEEGKVTALNLVSRDQTRDVKLKKRLEEQQDFIKQLDNLTLNGVYIYDFQKGKNTYVNKQYVDILGYTLKDIEEMSSESFLNCFHPDDRGKIVEHMTRVKKLKVHESEEIEYRFKTKKGNWIWCLSKDSGFDFDSNGKATSFMGAFVDISKQKEIEKNLSLRNKEMEQFAHEVSHDLKAPLNNMIMGLSILHEVVKKPEHIELQEQLIQSAQRMNEIINSLLAQAEIRKDQIKTEVSLMEILEEIQSDLGFFIKENEATINYKNLPVIYGIRPLLRLLFQNLITNSIKYKKENEAPRIIINTEDHIHYWRIEVVDNGIGIPKENHFDIFELFYRSDNTNKIEGTGIGLANCKRIVQKHGGEIWIESHVNEGTVFYFTLKKPEVDKKVK